MEPSSKTNGPPAGSSSGGVWLARHGLVADECRLIQVVGESMEPTLADGCAILMNGTSQRRRAGRIFYVRTDDGLIVKPAGRDRTGAWQLSATTRGSRIWPTVPWPADPPVISEVKRAARRLV